MRPLIAHSAPAPGLPNQPLFDAVNGVEAHAAGVARRAAEFAAAFGSERVAAWLGWWHDAGKTAPDVQAYLRGETDAKKGPDHSSAGMLAALDRLEPLAACIAGHHGGLADADALKVRIDRKRGEARVTDALATACPLIGRHAPTIGPESVPVFVRDEHALEFWLRMLHSALVDADGLDAEAFDSPARAALRERDGRLEPLWDALAADQERMTRTASPTDVNAARAEIYRACLDAADGPPGVYRLTVPTGGGKTRSAMAFALRHALRHGLRRVIVALPYTSIIEQNADVYRTLFRDANPDAVLEHHSAVATRETPGEETEAALRARLAAVTWDAPVIVTTTVQLFESLFASKNSRLRKLHRIARSVVILDEVQTLPVRLLDPTLDVLRTLARDYSVTVLLCTATPPALAAREGFAGLGEVHEIVPDPASLFRRLKRVEIGVEPEPWTWARAADAMRATPQALAVLNTKKAALALLDALGSTPGTLHLSTLLCGAHRRDVLAEVHRRLGTGDPCRLVSTQVVEAGVDLDFPVVLRARGPLDRIIQAAGRCNREGRLDGFGRVVVFEPAEDSAMPPGEYKAGGKQFDMLVREGHGTVDFDDPALVERYFRLLYGALGTDTAGVQPLRHRLLYEQTAAAYRLIEDEAVPVVVRYGVAASALARVSRQGFASRDDVTRLQPFFVNLRKADHERAERDGLVRSVADGIWEWMGAYDAPAGGGGRGLVWDIPNYSDTCVI